jgi:TonB family protein
VNWKRWILLIVFFAAGCPLAVYAADATPAMDLNNDGVIALKEGNYPLALQKFKGALKLDPDYQLARDNMAIAHNNYGLQLRSTPKEALKQFHQALYLNSGNPTTVANIDRTIKAIGKDPRLFKDRVALGDEAKLSGDFIGAIVEYSQALKINEDPAVRTKLAEATKILADCRASGKDDEGNRKPSVPIVDMGPYMADLQRRIKRAWFPPQGHQSDRVVVVFKIYRLGSMSDLKLTHSSGVAASDQAALDAVQHASPFRSLPAGAPDNVDIPFTFDYNAFNGGGRATIRSF